MERLPKCFGNWYTIYIRFHRGKEKRVANNNIPAIPRHKNGSLSFFVIFLLSRGRVTAL